jgi:hypothetical protein
MFITTLFIKKIETAVQTKPEHKLVQPPLTPNVDKRKKGQIRSFVSPASGLSEQRVPAYFLLWVFQPNNHAGSVKNGLGCYTLSGL